jgi:hypothetical protein
MEHIISFIGDWATAEKDMIRRFLNKYDRSTVKNSWTFSHYPGSIYFATKETWDERIRAESFEECFTKLKGCYYNE